MGLIRGLLDGTAYNPNICRAENLYTALNTHVLYVAKRLLSETLLRRNIFLHVTQSMIDGKSINTP